MPSRNRVKTYAPDTFYHVYSRGVNKRKIFPNDDDYVVFLNLFKRYLANEGSVDRYNRTYENLSDKITLLAFCLMPNHFHLLIYQKHELGMTDLLHRVLTSYTIYFNKKYSRSGPLFQDIYKASRISSDEYLQHISRYIHLNPQDWRRWDFSSLSYYLGEKNSKWLNPSRVLELFEDKEEYFKFTSDYLDYKISLDAIKTELADR